MAYQTLAVVCLLFSLRTTSMDKLTIRNHIAFCYLAFASVQLCILAIVAPHSLQWVQLTYAATSGVVFAVCERGIFHSISFPTFDRTFTIVIGCYSILIFLKIAGVFDNMSAAENGNKNEKRFPRG